MSTPDLLVIAGGLDPRRGGQERSIRECLTALAAAGAGVTLAAPRHPGDDIPLAGFEQLPVSGGTRLAQTRSLLRAAEGVSESHQSTHVVVSHLPVRCDLYVPRGGIYPEAYARSAASRPNPARRFLSSHVTTGARKELVRRERRLLADVRGPMLVALSEYVAEQGRRWYGLDESRIRVARNGVDLERVSAGRPLDRANLGVPDDATLILAAATNPRLKGVPQLISAHRRLARDDVRLLLVGGDPAPPARGVHHLGPRDDVPDLLATVDALAHPTFYDSSGRVVLEALAAGLPVLTTRHAGAWDEVGDQGIVINDPRDAAALSAALEEICRRDRGQPRDDVSMGRHVAGLLEIAHELRTRTR